MGCLVRDRASSVDSKFCAVWHFLFESFAPIGRGPAPAYQYLICALASALPGKPDGAQQDVRAMAFGTVTSIRDLDLAGYELSELFLSYADDISPSAARVIAARPELTGPPGTSELLGIIAGVVFALVKRMSYSARLKWFQSSGWRAVSRMLRGLDPCDQGLKSDPMARAGFDARRPVRGSAVR